MSHLANLKGSSELRNHLGIYIKTQTTSSSYPNPSTNSLLFNQMHKCRSLHSSNQTKSWACYAPKKGTFYALFSLSQSLKFCKYEIMLQDRILIF